MRLSKKKSFRVIDKKPCGSRSPYWDWMETRRRSDDALIEYPEANPDVLDESAHLYFKEIAEEDSLKLDALAKAWDHLSTQEKMVIEMCGYEGKTIEHASVITRLSRGAIQEYIKRARQKIQREYRRLVAKDSIAT